MRRLIEEKHREMVGCMIGGMISNTSMLSCKIGGFWKTVLGEWCQAIRREGVLTSGLRKY